MSVHSSLLLSIQGKNQELRIENKNLKEKVNMTTFFVMGHDKWYV